VFGPFKSVFKLLFFKKKVKSEVVSKKKTEFIYDSSNDLRYYKLICKQDLVRTPSIGKKVAEDFFNLNLDHGQSKTLLFSLKDKKIEVEINKRKTRNEYRFFLNRIKDEIDYNVNDILVISHENDVYIMELLRNKKTKRNFDYSEALIKMDGKQHVLSS
jgi:hypothetical protein